MEYPLAELADKFTILKLKSENGLDVEAELNAVAPLVVGVDTADLMEINRWMWDVEELISSETNLVKVGSYCLTLRVLSVRRVAAKNKIAEDAGQAIERKSY